MAGATRGSRERGARGLGGRRTALGGVLSKRAGAAFRDTELGLRSGVANRIVPRP